MTPEQQRDYAITVRSLRNAPLWQIRLANCAQAALLEPNNDAWPVTSKQMSRLADAFGLHLKIMPDIPVTAGAVDNIILVRDRGDDILIYQRAIHEIIEPSIRSGRIELEAPWTDQRLPHFIACIVEYRYAIYAAYIRAARDYMSQISGDNL